MIKLYHGSDKEVVKPIYGAGSADSDYGSGFYLTDDFEIAKIWGASNKEGGYVNTYKLDLSNMKVLWLNHADKNDILVWLALLCANRVDRETRLSSKEEIDFLISHFLPKVEEYDVIIGYRADDSYYLYTRAFLRNELPFELLKEAMELGQLGLQYVLISHQAFGEIKFVKSDRVPHSNDYLELEDVANKEYEKLLRKKSINQTYLRDIIREIDQS